jgi:hypothetical protein
MIALAATLLSGCIKQAWQSHLDQECQKQRCCGHLVTQHAFQIDVLLEVRETGRSQWAVMTSRVQKRNAADNIPTLHNADTLQRVFSYSMHRQQTL